MAVLPADATVVFRVAPGRVAAGLAELIPEAVAPALELAGTSALGACGGHGCLLLVDGPAALLNPAASPAALVPARRDVRAPDGAPVAWRVLGPGKAVLGDAAAVAAAWKGVQEEAPGFEPGEFARDVPDGDAWVLVVDPVGAGWDAMGRLDRMGADRGDAVIDALDRFDDAWPALRQRAVSVAAALSADDGLVRVRLRCRDEAAAADVEAEARARVALSPLAVESITRDALHVELVLRLPEVP